MNKHPLRKYLDKHNWSVAEFIERKKLKFSVTFIYGICDGTRNPSRKSAEILSEATGIPLEVLLLPENYPNFTTKI